MNQKFLWENLYNPNRELKNNLNSDDVIYSKNVVVFKSNSPDGSFVMEMRNWFKVDVISCAAPNLRERKDEERIIPKNDDLYEIFKKRIIRIFDAAKYNDVDILVLGAFGCGAYKNPPKIVAKAFHDVIKYRGGDFDIIAFPVFCREFEEENFEVFKNEFET